MGTNDYINKSRLIMLILFGALKKPIGCFFGKLKSLVIRHFEYVSMFYIKHVIGFINYSS